MEQTTNYQFNQWAAEDRIMREDFNADNAKLEQALAVQASLLGKCGNCRIVSMTYVGAGEYGSEAQNTLSFDSAPLLILVGGHSAGEHMCLFRNHDTAQMSHSDYDRTNYVAWEETSVSWYNKTSSVYQFNQSDRTYYVVAFFSQS